MQAAAEAAGPCPMPEDGACLLPLDRFDHPALRQRPPKWLPLPFVRSHLNTLFGKACAGMRPGVRADGWDVVQGFRRGVLSRRELATLRWAAPGLWEDALGMLHVMGRAAIFELGRGVHHMGWHGRGLAWELRALSLPLGHPDRREWLEDGPTCLTVDGLTFVVNSAALERLQRRRRLAKLTANHSQNASVG